MNEKQYLSQFCRLIDIALQRKLDGQPGDGDAIMRLINAVRGNVPAEDISDDRRSGVRYKLDHEAVIQIVHKGGDVMCLPAVIRNISLSGVLLEVGDKGHVYSEMLKDIEGFSVLFLIPGEKDPVMMECQPRRMELSMDLGVGATFSEFSKKSIVM